MSKFEAKVCLILAELYRGYPIVSYSLVELSVLVCVRQQIHSKRFSSILCILITSCGNTHVNNNNNNV